MGAFDDAPIVLRPLDILVFQNPVEIGSAKARKRNIFVKNPSDSAIFICQREKTLGDLTPFGMEALLAKGKRFDFKITLRLFSHKLLLHAARSQIDDIPDIAIVLVRIGG